MTVWMNTVWKLSGGVTLKPENRGLRSSASHTGGGERLRSFGGS